MQGYETIVVLSPDLSQEQSDGLMDKFKKIISTEGGNVVHHNVWGRRKLAYEVKKREYGVYHLLYHDRTPTALRTLENQFRIEDEVLKWMSVAVEDVDVEHTAFERLKTEGTIAQNLTD